MRADGRRASRAAGHRVALALVLASANAAPARPDDRQLLQASSGAKMDVLVILDSSSSMAREFSDRFDLPASLDDFVYPEGTVGSTNGSKLGVARSVLRQIMTTTPDVNWAFATFRNPNPTFGAAFTGDGVYAPSGAAMGGAHRRGDTLENGGLEWLYVADCRVADPSRSCPDAAISDIFPCVRQTPLSRWDCYSDIQQGRILEFGHRVARLYNREDTGELADTLYPYTSSGTRSPAPAGVPNPQDEPEPGFWRGAFGPNPAHDGTAADGAFADSGLAVYRNPSKPGRELRLKVVSGRYGDEGLVVRVEEFRAPPASGTPTRTPTETGTPTPSFTPTPTQTATPSSTRTPTPSKTATPSKTRTNTRTATPTRTPTPTRTAAPAATGTPTITPTPAPILAATRNPIAAFPGGRLRAGGLLPAVMKWFSPMVRGLLALSPPPPGSYPVPGAPCAGVPQNVLRHPLYCGRCIQLYRRDDGQGDYQSQGAFDFWRANQSYNAGSLVAPATYNGFIFRALNGGATGATEPGWAGEIGATVIENAADPTRSILWRAEPEPLCGFVDADDDGKPDLQNTGRRNPWPLSDRGFDDPQADPDPAFVYSGAACGRNEDQECRIDIRYKRADLYDFPDPDTDNPMFPYRTHANDAKNGNPPWGSQASDGDADALSDSGFLPDRGNRGAFAAFSNSDRYPSAQQKPNDAFAEPSHPVGVGAPDPCDVYSQDCGGIALRNCGGLSPCIAPSDAAGATYNPYPDTPPPAPETWPLVPFPRDWMPSDADSTTAIKRLLRFASSIVSFDATAPHMFEYRLEEDASNVVVVAPGAPIAGSLRDAYNYFRNSVFRQTDDPDVNCRVFKIVLITAGVDSAFADACSGGPTGKGPSGDLGVIPLPESPPGTRARQHAADPSVPVAGIPVFVIGLGAQSPDGSPDPSRRCIADNSGGQFIAANSRARLVAAFQSVLRPGPSTGFFAAPSIPALAGNAGDEAIVGGVVPSHFNPAVTPAASASWAIWNGSLKAYRLDPTTGDIPVAADATATATAAPSGTPTPVPNTTPARSHPDESNPDDTDSAARRPAWNAARVLGYTDPVASLAGGLAAMTTSASRANAPAISVWPGRRMVWGDGTGPAVPIPRRDFMPNTGTCAGSCFSDLTAAMGLNPSVSSDVTKATRTVQFVRGGKSPVTGSRDEILNDLGTYGSVTPGSEYSYFYQDDPPAGNPASAQTDGATDPPGYAHKLGDIFHSEAVVLLPPKYFQFLSANVTPRTGVCGDLPDCSYGTFATFHSKRRRVALVGSNDGFLHAFDAGVYDRNDDAGQVGPTASHPFNDTYDPGTGREIFAYAPRAVMNPKFPNLLNFPPTPQYFVDGSPALADVFIDTAHGGAPSPGNRTWKTVLIGGLRQGGRHYFALDITQPDRVGANGTKTSDKDSSPDCLDGGAGCAAPYPTILWEMTDDCPGTCVGNTSPMGETWSRPVLGRIRVASGSGTEDLFVAIFGGGFDSAFVSGTEVPATDTATRGRAIYIVNVETGKVLYKATAGRDAGGNPVQFAPMPAPPAVADIDDDGYLDVAYIGDLNGRMWRLDLKSGQCAGCGTASETLTGYRPFLLYDALKNGSQAQPIQPIFLDAGIIFLAGGPSPTLGVGFGSGYRAELLRANENVNRFQFVIDSGADARTFHDTDLVNITPNGGATPGSATGPVPARACGTDPSQTHCGYFLDFATPNEKAVSTVLSTLGNLSLVTFTPDPFNSDPGLCLSGGSSHRYSFSFRTGQGSYGPPTATGQAGNLADYRQSLGIGMAQAAQSQAPGGDIIQAVWFSGGGINQANTSATLKAINQSWKEQ